MKTFFLVDDVAITDSQFFLIAGPCVIESEAMAREIKRITGIPVVTLPYDGTSGNKNDVVVSYLNSVTRNAPDSLQMPEAWSLKPGA